MTYRAKRKTKNLIASFVLLFALGLSAIATTYAWFAVTKLSLMETDFVSGEMGISVTSVTAYKYVYPVYEGTTMINYDSPSAAVQTSDVTGVTNSDNNDYLHLNKLDTMQIYLDNNASSDITETAIRPKITGQKTSLLLKIIFTAVNPPATPRITLITAMSPTIWSTLISWRATLSPSPVTSIQI